jgi:hypothetical protein
MEGTDCEKSWNNIWSINELQEETNGRKVKKGNNLKWQNGLVSIQLQQQEEQQLKEMNGRKVKEEINPGNHEMGCLLSIQLQ